MKVVLFDVDGVLTLPEEFFSQFYAKSRGLDPEPFEKFFQESWREIRIGKKDLKEHISENPDLWQRSGTPDELVDIWCKTEDVRNQELVDVIQQIKEAGIPCCMATDQERYRGNYIRDVMFPGLFDDYYISSELGMEKSEPEFFTTVLEKLESNHLGLVPSDVIFFDDSQSKIDSAKNVGLDARLYTSIDQVRDILNS